MKVARSLLGGVAALALASSLSAGGETVDAAPRAPVLPATGQHRGPDDALGRAGVLQGNSAATSPVSLRFVGDVIFGRYKEDGYQRRPRDLSHVFDDVRGVLSADFSLANLETPIVRELPKQQPVAGQLVFGAEAAVVPVLRASGVTAVSLANNHAADQRTAGLVATPALLREAGIHAFGAGGEGLKLSSIAVRGLTVGVIALTTLLNFELPDSYPAVPFVPPRRVAERVGPLLTSARASHDLLIVSVHWGNEYENQPTRLQRAVAADLVRAGADIVAGHHPHVLQPVELNDGAIVAYSLGNFLFDAALAEARVSGILTVDVTLPNCTATVGLVPVEIALYPALHPTLAKGRTAALARGQVQRGTRVSWSQTGEHLTTELRLRHCAARLLQP